MNFNHLMDARIVKRRCLDTNLECYWVPIGNVRSTQGDNVYMTMGCNKCGKREDIFLSKEAYFVQQKLIQRELNNA